MAIQTVETPPDTRPAVLVVEDSDEQRAALTLQIGKLGYEVVAASNCAESREFLKSAKFACCIVDNGLPDGRGVDLLEEFHAADPNMVTVMLTGQNDPDTVIEAIRGGAFDYLLKPIDLMALRAGVSRALTHHNLLREREELVALLRTERDRLRFKVEEATADIRNYAKECETTNSLLSTLLQIAQLSESHRSEESLLGAVLEKMREHVPLATIALCDLQRNEFVCVKRHEKGNLEAVRAGIESSGSGTAFAPTEADLLTSYWVRRHTGLVTASYSNAVFPYGEKSRPHHTVGFYLDLDFSPTAPEQEFLATCAHFVAYECQRYRLMLHAAQQASLGNIAVELSRSFLQSLTAMQTASDFVMETATTDDDREGVEIIRHNVEVMTGQVHHFTQLARHRKDSIETVELSTFIDRSLALLAGSIDNRGVRINREIETSDRCVLLNGDALARTFLDLIASAVRNVKRGGVVDIAVTEADAHHVECAIRHGIASGPLFKIAGETARVDEFADIRNHPAYVLAQRTVQNSGGKLHLEESEGDQIAFRILLPKNATETQAAVGADS